MSEVVEFRVDGKRVLARTAGDRHNGEVVVFVHGAGLDGSVWEYQLGPLAAAGFRPLAVDLPGHGGSEGPALHGIDALGVWLSNYLDAAAVEKAHLVGHSMGALVVLEVAAVTPSRVASLAVLGVAESMAVNADLLDAAERNDALALEQMSRWMHARDPDGRSDWGPDDTFASMGRAEAGVLFGDLSACNNYGDATVPAYEVDAPALLLLGGQDVMARPNAATPIGEAIDRSSTVVVHGAGHMLMVERPDDVNDALIGFLLDAAAE